MRIIVVDSEERRTRLVSALSKLPLEPTLQVTIEEYDPKRSGQQNKRYWLLAEAMAQKTGYDKDTVHEFLKGKFLGTRVVEIAGERAEVRPSSKLLKSKDFNLYMEQCEQFAIEQLGVWLE